MELSHYRAALTSVAEALPSNCATTVTLVSMVYDLHLQYSHLPLAHSCRWLHRHHTSRASVRLSHTQSHTVIWNLQFIDTRCGYLVIACQGGILKLSPVLYRHTSPCRVVTRHDQGQFGSPCLYRHAAIYAEIQ